jgi:tetrachlorobenzoquinone reductase
MISTVVRSVVPIAEGVRMLELVAVAGPLPGFRAGDHIDLELAPGLVRSYSLVGAPEPAPGCYRVAVALERDGRGGSRLVHSLHEGARLVVRPPVGGFPLLENAAHTVLIAGGIGITPILSMVRRLVQLDASWELHYAARSPRATAFLPLLEALDPGHQRVRLYLGEGGGARRLEVGRVIAATPPTGHLYCCGPTALLDEFVAATAGIDPGRVHLERFRADEVVAADNQGLTVELALSGRTIQVGDGETILDALLDAGVEVPFSCMEGVCGSCRTKVLDGTPDHRDSVLSAAERAAGETMIVCTSRAKGDHLVLDL